MDSIAKDWKALREELELNIKEAQKKSEKENAKTLELMLKMLENSKIRVNKEQQFE